VHRLEERRVMFDEWLVWTTPFFWANTSLSMRFIIVFLRFQFVIGQAYTQKPSAEPRGLPFVIGAAANGRKVTRPMAEARAALAAIGAAQVDAPTPSTRKRPIVIGLRHDRR